MKNNLLIITKYNGDYIDILENNCKKYEVTWLQLWPVVGTQEMQNKYPSLKIIKSSEHINNDDHYRIADEVTNISNNWWHLLDFNSLGEEWNIDDLKISKIFTYEMEQVLTKIMFHLLTINKVIENTKPNELLFIEKKAAENHSNEIWNKFSTFELSNFYNSNKKGIRVRKEYLSTDNIARISPHNSRIMKVLMHPDLVLRKKKLKLKTSRLINDSIVLSNSYRCMHLFVENASKKQNVFVLKDSAFYRPTKKDKALLIKSSFNELFFDAVSLTPFFLEILPTIENKYYTLKDFYKKLIDFIILHKPNMYITVSIADSSEMLKMWAFKQSNIRTVIAAEGLGQPGGKLNIVLNSVLHPEINIERWSMSENFAKSDFFKNSRTRITGYFDIKKRRSDFKLFSTRKKRIVFALSMESNFVARAIVYEGMFNNIQSVKDVANIVSKLSDYELIIKLHPGDFVNIELYKEAILNKNNVKIISTGDIDGIIETSKLVIMVDTSVGLESLLKRKNVIAYNYMGRPTYTTSIYDHLNHDPKKGAALIMTNNIDELKKAIHKLLPYGNNTKPSPGLEYVLENAKVDYNIQEVVSQLLENE
jgi:hypothetical protein